MSVKPIPEGYHGITPYLGINEAAKAIEFYKKAFGASVFMRLDMPDGRVGHAELRIGEAVIMLGTPCDETALRNPDAHPSVGLHLYVNDVDAQFKQAVDAGASAVSEPQDQFYVTWTPAQVIVLFHGLPLTALLVMTIWLGRNAYRGVRSTNP